MAFMELGTLPLKNNLFLAPMSGITDYPFRRLVKEFGCGLVFTGMVSAEGLLSKGRAFLAIGEEEHPVSVQLIGSNPEILAKAAQMAEDIGADAVDINMGCSVSQVVETGAGVDLMRYPAKVEKILDIVRKTIKIPLTIKIRSGWSQEQINAIEISKIAEDCGVDAIIIHPRTKVQGFRGQANWDVIKRIKVGIHVPVIGNGDVKTTILAKKILEETGCDGVMIGRGALGSPWIFSSGDFFLPEEKSGISPPIRERKRVIERHFLLLQDHYGDKRAMKEIRKHMIWYTKGIPFSTSFRSKISGMREKEKEILFEAIASYFDFVQRRELCQRSTSEENRSVTGLGKRGF